MQRTRTAARAAATALALLAGATAAQAACAVEGLAYRGLEGLPDDPTGPSLYLKVSPDAGFAYLLRLRDGRFLDRIAGEDRDVRVLVRGSAADCPATGRLRDLGTAARAPRILASVGWLRERPQSIKPAPETSPPQSPTAPTDEIGE